MKHDVAIQKWQSSISVLNLYPLIIPNAMTRCFKSNYLFADVYYEERKKKICSNTVPVSDHSN